MALPSTALFVGGMPGGPELIVILLIAVLLFGANKIPKLARATGQAMGEFQRGREEIEEEIEQIQNPTQSMGSDTELGESSGAESSTESEPSTESSGAESSTESEPSTESSKE